MNKLEQRIADECGFRKMGGGYANSDIRTAQIAARIALELAEKAWYDGYKNGTNHTANEAEDFINQEL
jgi:hypothetical protein